MFFLLKIIVKVSMVRTILAIFESSFDVTNDITQVYDVIIRYKLSQCNYRAMITMVMVRVYIVEIQRKSKYMRMNQINSSLRLLEI